MGHASESMIMHFNPRSPHGERPGVSVGVVQNVAFQSTLPARGATCSRCRFSARYWHFNPRSPHGERHRAGMDAHHKWHFNPRSPHGERRAFPTVGGFIAAFQSTLPARGATPVTSMLSTLTAISIHAPRTGSDAKGALRRPDRARDFNPRSPHGERPRSSSTTTSSSNFNPRSPHGERRWAQGQRVRRSIISIHAPRTGSDKPAA